MSITAAGLGGDADGVLELLLPNGVLDDAGDHAAASFASRRSKSGAGVVDGRELSPDSSNQPRHRDGLRRHSPGDAPSEGHQGVGSAALHQMTKVRAALES